MKFPCVFLNIPNSIALNFICKSVFFFKTLLIAALTHLGLLKQQQQSTDEDDNINPNYVLLFDRQCPIPVPVSVEVLTAVIKRKLEVKKFNKGDDEDEEFVCPVCLDLLENTDEIRELCNCYHVFHRECLDTWVDKGHVTCPICRSMLFPDNLLAAERIALFAPADSIAS